MLPNLMTDMTIQNLKAVIFDLDGTLVNTISDLASSVEQALTEYHLPGHTLAEYTSYVGNGTLKLVERSLPADIRQDKASVCKVHDRFSEIYAEHYCDTSYVYDGIAETLEYLQDRGVALCVNSNKPDVFTKSIISKLFPSINFAYVFGARDGIPKKPDPQSEFEIIANLEFDKSQVLHIGDSDVDIATAHNAGIKCVGCAWGFRPKETLGDADYIVTTPKELKDFFKNSCNL